MNPFEGGDGVLPEELLGSGPAFREEVGAEDFEGRFVAAGIDEVVFAEDVPDEVHDGFVDGRVKRLIAGVAGAMEAGEFDEGVPLTEGAEMAGVGLENGGVGGQGKGLEMAEDDAEVRNLVGEAEGGFDEIEAGVGDFEGEAGLGVGLHVFDEEGLVDGGDEVLPFPDVAVADAEKKLVAVVAFEVLAELGDGGVEVADHAGDDGFVFDHHEDPEIVFDPGAGFDFDAADDAEREGGFAVVVGEEGRVVGGEGKRGALGAGLVVEVKVGVDDGDGVVVCGSSRGSGGDGGEPGAAAEGGGSGDGAHEGELLFGSRFYMRGERGGADGCKLEADGIWIRAETP